MRKNIKICVICGKPFPCPPSSKKVTCSTVCRKAYAAIRNTGRKFSEESKRKISEKAKGRDMTELQIIATEKAKQSPNSGRFPTNINAKQWHLISPDGKEYKFRSLRNWLRENCRELFGCEPDTREFENVCSGLNGAKRGYMGKNYPCSTYKGWQAIPTEDDL